MGLSAAVVVRGVLWVRKESILGRLEAAEGKLGKQVHADRELVQRKQK